MTLKRLVSLRAVLPNFHRAFSFPSSFAVVLLLACGSPPVPAPQTAEPQKVANKPSGLPQTSRLSELTPEQQRALCEWNIETLGGPDRFQWCQEPCHDGACAEGLKAQPWSIKNCLDFMARTQSCAATVLEFEQCAEHLAPDLCVDPGESCAPNEAC